MGKKIHFTTGSFTESVSKPDFYIEVMLPAVFCPLLSFLSFSSAHWLYDTQKLQIYTFDQTKQQKAHSWLPPHVLWLLVYFWSPSVCTAVGRRRGLTRLKLSGWTATAKVDPSSEPLKESRNRNLSSTWAAGLFTCICCEERWDGGIRRDRGREGQRDK